MKTWSAGEKVNASDLNGNFTEVAVNSGDYSARTAGTIYQAAENGFLVLSINSNSQTYVYVEANSNPTRVISTASLNYITNVTIPIKKNLYYKFTSSSTSYAWWIPWTA